MARDTYGQSFFGEITNRLSRLLRLEGRIPVKLQEGVTPVVVVGDGLAPGMASFSGRRWAVNPQSSTVIAVAASSGGEGVIVDGWHLRDTNAATVISYWWAPPAAVSGWGAGLVAPTPAQVLDSPAVDIPPLQVFQGVLSASCVQIASLPNYPATAADIKMEGFSFYLAPGCGLRIASTVGNLAGIIYGRVF